MLKKQLIESIAGIPLILLVTESGDAEFKIAKASARLDKIVDSIGDTVALRMRGLPFDVTEREVAQFFSAYRLVEGSIKIGETAMGQRTGEAVLQFESQEEAKKAFAERQGDKIGHRWIELYLIRLSQYLSFDYRYCLPSLGNKFIVRRRGLTR